MSTQYTLEFINESSTAGAACLYQTAPPGLQSLAWLVREVAAATADTPGTASFAWTPSYGYMFMEQSSSGTSFAQVMSADPAGPDNAVTFTVTNAGYAFVDPTAGTAGSLTITESSNVLVGFAMYGAPLFGATPASTTLTLPATAAPAYQLAFGSFTPGQVMPAPGTTPAPVAVTFPSGVFSMTATLSAANVITVVPTTT